MNHKDEFPGKWRENGVKVTGIVVPSTVCACLAELALR